MIHVLSGTRFVVIVLSLLAVQVILTFHVTTNRIETE